MANGIPVTVGVNTKSHNRMVNIRPGSDTNRWFAAPHRADPWVIKTNSMLQNLQLLYSTHSARDLKRAPTPMIA
jgi:hypothetical protein